MLLDRLIPRLKVEEGWRSKVYIDTTGHLTIGHGLNLGRIDWERRKVYPVNGLTTHEGELILVRQITEVLEEIAQRLPWWDRLDEARQLVLADMAFNIRNFYENASVRLLPAVQRGDYALAADIMESWLWAKQVPNRARPLIKIMRTGVIE